MTAVVGIRPPCEGADHLRHIYMILLQVERAVRPFPLIMCRKLTAFLGLRIGNYSSAAKNAVSALLLGGLAERKRCPWRTLASTVAPPSSCHPARRGRRPRRPASPLSSRPSEASGGIWEPTPIPKRFLRSVAAASSVEMTGKTLASTVWRSQMGEVAFCPLGKMTEGVAASSAKPFDSHFTLV